MFTCKTFSPPKCYCMFLYIKNIACFTTVSRFSKNMVELQTEKKNFKQYRIAFLSNAKRRLCQNIRL
jgi:hypothetical protein